METFRNQPSPVSWENLLDWKRQARSFEALTPFRAQTVNLTGLEMPGRIRGGFVTSDFFPLAGVAVAQGRALTAADDQRSGQ